MRSMTFLQVDRCSNEPFSTNCVYCVFYKFILRILHILQIVILEYCVYCVFYKLTAANIAYIAYIAYIALRILRNIALRRVAYFTTSQLYIYTWAERANVRVKCLAQEHNTMSPASARTQTARAGVERTNHEATAPPTLCRHGALKVR